MFTSSLSPNEILLLKEAGFAPIDIVAGASIYVSNYSEQSVDNWRRSNKMEELTEDMYAALGLALASIEAEAANLGADGVVGTRIEFNGEKWYWESVELVAVGTAIVSIDSPGSYRNNLGRPFTTSLSGQDFCMLLRCGYRPLGIVMGDCVYHTPRVDEANYMNCDDRSELVLQTEATHEQRRLAMERMSKEAHVLGADGIVGADIYRDRCPLCGSFHEFRALGTAVKIVEGCGVIPRPVLALPLQDWDNI